MEVKGLRAKCEALDEGVSFLEEQTQQLLATIGELRAALRASQEEAAAAHIKCAGLQGRSEAAEAAAARLGDELSEADAHEDAAVALADRMADILTLLRTAQTAHGARTRRRRPEGADDA